MDPLDQFGGPGTQVFLIDFILLVDYEAHRSSLVKKIIGSQLPHNSQRRERASPDSRFVSERIGWLRPDRFLASHLGRLQSPAHKASCPCATLQTSICQESVPTFRRGSRRCTFARSTIQADMRPLTGFSLFLDLCREDARQPREGNRRICRGMPRQRRVIQALSGDLHNPKHGMR